MDLIVPSYKLPRENVFNFRQKEFQDAKIVSTIQEMLKCAEKYDIILQKISLSSRKKPDQAEIKKTISRTLKISLSIKGGTKEIELKYEIPWLQSNYFYIGGNRKIPIYQMFDKPLITRGNTLKIRTNIQTVQMDYVVNRRSGYYYVVNIFNKKIPLVYFLLALYGEDVLRERFTLKDGDVFANESEQQLYEDVFVVLNDEVLDTTKIFIKYFKGKTDSEIIENILLITEIDAFSMKYMHTDNLIEELVWAINNPKIDDCNLENKRLRCMEYFLYHFLAKDFYNMIMSLKRSKRDTFSNNSKIILVNANTSPVIQYEAPLNPLDELARLSRVALTGPGGFKKDNIPPYLRDIHPSMKGRICPADTGDRENCGALQYIVPPMQMCTDGLFPKNKSDVTTSISISHIPFLEHDDPTRLQMASSQMRHSIMLKEFDVPWLQSGIEGMYTQFTSFIFHAERNGKVIFKDRDVIIVQYDNNKCRAYNIGYKKSRLSVVDYYNTYFNSEDINKSLPEDEQLPTQFKKGDIVAESNFLKDGRLNIGRQLRTCIMPWYGYNYEDSIIVNEECKDKFTSLHYLDLTFELGQDKVLLDLGNDPDNYKPLPVVGDKMKKGDVYAIIKTLSNKNDSYNDSVFDLPSEKTVDEDCIVTDVKIFVHKKNKLLPVFEDWVQSKVQSQNNRKLDLISNLRHHLTKDELEQFLLDLEIDESNKEEGRYKIKGETIDGILINITAIYERPLQIGDKLGNRHGNKGVISIIVPENKMPLCEDGLPAEIIINPLGIISRMNVGQLFELHLSQSFYDLKQAIKKKFVEGVELISEKTKHEFIPDNLHESQIEMYDLLRDHIYDYILGFIDLIDKTQNPRKNYTKQVKSKLNEMTIHEFVENLDDWYLIQPPFQSVMIEDLNLAMEYTGSKYEYPCYEPIAKQNTLNDVAFGFMYFEKLNHIAKDKHACRGIGPYASKTNQPLHGKIRKGGQRIGEMEQWSLIAHDAMENLQEINTTKSDSIKYRNDYIGGMIQNVDLLWDDHTEDHVSQSLRVFQCYQQSLGLGFHINEEELPAADYDIGINKTNMSDIEIKGNNLDAVMRENEKPEDEINE